MEANGDQKELHLLLAVVRQVFQKSGEWPTRQYVRAVLDQDFSVDLDKVLASEPRELVRASGSQPDASVSLTVTGLHLAGAMTEVARFVEALRWCVEQALGFRPSHPGKAENPELSSGDFVQEWNSRGEEVDDLDLTKLRAMILVEGIFDWFSGEGADWAMTLSYDRLRQFRAVNSVADYLQVVAARESPGEPAAPLVSESSVAQIATVQAVDPPIGTDHLAPRVREACAPLFRDAHFAHGVHEATKAMRDLIREASGLTEDGDPLVGKALGGPDPSIQVADLTTESGRNVQRGTKLIAMGVLAAIRNPLAHERRELNALEATEMIAMINFVVRAIESRPGKTR